ncbi:hypothetical protein LTR62_007739 [Meristemomyces frigidus]|uniref:FAS1 domain-containing protein n=1 Tax=Meristemomyces frigidus TaxID=1508187 RepID=A0AAN7TLS5_9PEZI|nr:hypothetical protein LTR62_007739 [Meristemomyces frigidus]
MKPYALATTVLASAVLLTTTQAQLLPFLHNSKPATPNTDNRQQPLAHQPGLQMPNDPPNPTVENSPATQTASVTLSDILGTYRNLNTFAALTRDVHTINTRLASSSQNTTVLAPSNHALSLLPRKPWESPQDYSKLGPQAYSGDEGRERADENLRRFTEAHILLCSPWKEGEKVKTMAGTEVWWEVRDGGKKVLMPGAVEVEKVVSRVANGEVWLLSSALNYAL